MTFLEYAKAHHNFDVFLVLIDDAGLTDEEICEKFDVSRQRIYDARKRLQPIIDALAQVEPYKKDMRDKNIQEITEAFSNAFGTTKTSQYDRYAAKRLYLKHGTENIVAVINALSQSTSDKYCPVVNSVTHLENKLPSIIAYLKKQSNNQMVEL